MGSKYLLEEGVGQHSRNVSYPSWHGGGLRTGRCSDVDDLGRTPRLPRGHDCTAMELIREISTLENEIVHLEKYLLSLYRAVFNQCIADSSAIGEQTRCSNSCTESQFGSAEKLMECSKVSGDLRASSAGNENHARHGHRYLAKEKHGEVGDDGYAALNNNSRVHSRAISDISCLSEEISKKEMFAAPCSQTLADHLCASTRENILETPSKLSEDIIRCISAVYCKLNDARVPQTTMSSPFSSLSSSTMSSTFSIQDRSDYWSPRCSYDNVQSPLKEKHDLFSANIEVSRISIDKGTFKCAAALLERHRCLVKRLEAVDPSKLGDEEKLAFWINIHNGLIMHAFIAYGLENNHIRNSPLILKKSYNVGGCSFNAYEIQSTILGCNAHCKNSKSIFSPLKASIMNTKHPFALKQLEPLVHFALSMGAHSDPPVRAYTSKNVIKQLEIAKEEFIQANVFVGRENKVMLPKILELYAKDASLDLPSLMEAVHDCLPRDRQHSFRECLKGKLERRTQWSPYKSTFRYILHRDLDTNPHSDKQ